MSIIYRTTIQHKTICEGNIIQTENSTISLDDELMMIND